MILNKVTTWANNIMFSNVLMNNSPWHVLPPPLTFFPPAVSYISRVLPQSNTAVRECI